MIRYSFFVVIVLIAAPCFAAPPKLTSLSPTGAKLGSESVITAAGEFSTWPVEAWIDRPGITIKAEADKGRFRVTVAVDATPGVAWVRLSNAEGASALRPLFIDQLPEVLEAEPNDEVAKPQRVEAQCIVSGKLAKNGDLDAYQVTLKQGETLVASLRAKNILGSPMDGVLQVCELRERRVSSVAGSPPQVEAFVVAQNNDAVGLDPQLAYTAKRDGNYLVRVFAFPSEPDSGINFAGGENYLYRLTITTGGLVEHALPSPESPEKWLAFGPGLPEQGMAARVAEVADTTHRMLSVEGIAGAATLPLKDAGIIVGRLSPEAAHSQPLVAKKGDKFDVRVRSRSLGFPLDGVLTIDDAAGKELQRVDDTDKQADPQLLFTAPADGNYKLALRDLHGRGGARFVYWLDVAPAKPAFSLALAADAFVVAPGKTVEVPVTIDRKHGHQEPIKFRLRANSGELPAGISAAEVTADANAKTAKLVIAAAADAPLSNFAAEVVGDDGQGTSIALPPSPAPLAVPARAVWITVKP